MKRHIVGAATLISLSIILMIVSAALADNFNPDADYSLEVFATNTPFNEGSENPNATRVFSSGNDIYLVARYYTKIYGTVGHYLIVTNSAGQVVDFSYYAIDRDVNPHSFYFKKQYPVGSYSFNYVIFGQGGIAMSPNSFSFIVVND